ncbi:hypothetical protein PVT68_18215 [Microbulbifer bruguierae]|uniref:Uncharacterized protein n=1 Tax=Microbulbifer bruguierae TaxID=3029061 RepID=A0ABY8NCM2_9GAMM|nr:hypothetical protein [Microbulbifer bruguierae]WGL16673.1 hypothetical protein PVT68_18215 [Microbulbifer bruguierae]
MINWYRKRRLVGLVKELAIYNDKGIKWANHNDFQAETERQRLMHLIEFQLGKLGNSHAPIELLEAVENGSLKTDSTGMYVATAKQAKL